MAVVDGKIQIWATLPILNPEYDDANPGVDGTRAPPKKLCTLSMHAGMSHPSTLSEYNLIERMSQDPCYVCDGHIPASGWRVAPTILLL